MLRWALAALHLLALGVGLGAIWVRALALRGALDAAGVRRVLGADTLWGVAAVVWIGTGLARAFTGLEKGSAYYLHNRFFLAKMVVLVVILALEVRPMLALIRWRVQQARGGAVDPSGARGFARTSFAQAVLVVVMVLLATAMARGYGAF